MPPDVRTRLSDIERAAAEILTFAAGKTASLYAADRLLQRAVERDFEIIGEALAALRDQDPASIATIGDWPQIIAFRNLLVHRYWRVDHGRVWRMIAEDLPPLLSQVRQLLSAASPDSGDPTPGSGQSQEPEPSQDSQ
ncbi:MAG: DUF86 domain-containing protein [Planctomycetota bacterium]